MTKNLVTLLVVVLVVVAAGTGVAVYKNSKKSTPSTNTTTQQQMGDMDGDESVKATTNDHDSDESSTSTTTAPASTSAVSIKDFVFSSSAITVKKGTKVTWTNNDSTSHTVTSDSGPTSFDSGTLGAGQAFSFTFDTVGTYTYHCTFHPNMTGSVKVTE